MKKVLLIFTMAVIFFSAHATDPEEMWNTVYPQIESRIKAPTFADKDYNILDYGKRSKKKGHLYTQLINNVIEQCSKQGGGRVIIPAGEWLTGPITLKSNVNLHLEEGATLLFTTDPKEFPVVFTRWEGMDCYNYQPCIYAIDAENVALTGKGTVDGAAENGNWWRMCGKPVYGYTDGIISQKIGRPLLQEWNENGTPVEKRVLGDGMGMRPQLVNFVNCKNVLIEDVTLLRSPFWVIHPLWCENVTVRGVHIQNDGPNGDGCDPESCKDVLIERCYFDTGDDCIAIKSGRNRDGREDGRPSENFIVRDCVMKNGHGGVVVGSEISGGFRNLFAERCVMDSPDLERVIRIKTNPCRGGVIENIYVRDIKVGQCDEAVLKINVDYEPKEACDRSYPPVIRDVYLDRVDCNKSRYGVMLIGLKDVCNVYNVECKNCVWDNVKSGNSFTGMYRNVRLANVTINGKKVNEYAPMSQRMAQSEMIRFPESWQLDYVKAPKWQYAIGVELDAMLALADTYGDTAFRDYALAYADTMVNAQGKIWKYKPAEYNIDHLKNGTVLMAALDITGDKKYRTALDTLWSQLKSHPRTKEGSFWHKKVYPHQVWLDGLYMGQPFYIKYANRFLNDEEKAAVYNDIADQFLAIARNAYDPATGLYRHAWDEAREQFWADKTTGQSKHAWGRAQGWYIWALTDVLEELPADNPRRPELIALLKSIADGILKYQDPETGLWYQVLDQPGREGNYLESTASSMYVYNLLRASRLGLLDDAKYAEAARKGYDGMLKNFIKENEDGTVSLTQCCAVAGLGGKDRRDGTFEYYISEQVRDNDPKGVGPFIFAALEVEGEQFK